MSKENYKPNHIKWFIVRDKSFINPQSIFDPSTGEEIKDSRIISKQRTPEFEESVLGDPEDKITVVAVPVLSIEGHEVALPEQISAGDIRFLEIIEGEIPPEDEEFFVKIIEPDPKKGTVEVEQDTKWRFRVAVKNKTNDKATLIASIKNTEKENSKEFQLPPFEVKENFDNTIPLEYTFVTENFEPGLYSFKLTLFQHHTFGRNKSSEDEIKIQIVEKGAGTTPQAEERLSDEDIDNLLKDLDKKKEEPKFAIVIRNEQKELFSLEQDQTIKLEANKKHGISAIKLNEINPNYKLKLKSITKEHDLFKQEMILGFQKKVLLEFLLIEETGKTIQERKILVEIKTPETQQEQIQDIDFIKPAKTRENIIVETDIPYPLEFKVEGNTTEELTYLVYVNETPDEEEPNKQKKHILGSYTTPKNNTIIFKSDYFEQNKEYTIFVILSNKKGETLRDNDGTTIDSEITIKIKEKLEPTEEIVKQTIIIADENHDIKGEFEQDGEIELEELKRYYIVQEIETESNKEYKFLLEESINQSSVKEHQNNKNQSIEITANNEGEIMGYIADSTFTEMFSTIFIKVKLISKEEERTKTEPILPEDILKELQAFKQTLYIYDKNEIPIETITKEAQEIFLEQGDYFIEQFIERDQKEVLNLMDKNQIKSLISETVEIKTPNVKIIKPYQRYPLKVKRDGKISSEIIDQRDNKTISIVNAKVTLLLQEEPLGESTIYFIDPETKEKISSKTLEVKENQEYPFAYRTSINKGTVLHTKFMVIPGPKYETFTEDSDELTANETQFIRKFTKDDFDDKENLSIQQIELLDENNQLIGTDRIFVKLITDAPKRPFLTFIDPSKNGKPISETTKEILLENSDLYKTKVGKLELNWNTNLTSKNSPKNLYQIRCSKIRENAQEEFTITDFLKMDERYTQIELLEDDFPISTKLIKVEIKVIDPSGKPIKEAGGVKDLRDFFYVKLIGETESINPTISIFEITNKPRLIIKTNKNTSIELESNKKYQINNSENFGEDESLIWEHTLNSEKLKREQTEGSFEVLPLRTGPASLLCTKIKNNEIIGKTRIDIRLVKANIIPPERALTSRPIIEVIKEDTKGQKTYLGPIHENTTVSLEPETKYFLTADKQKPEALIRWIDNIEGKNPVIEQARGIIRETTKLSDRILTAEIVDSITNQVIGRTTVQIKVEPKLLQAAPKPKQLGPAQPEKEKAFNDSQNYFNNIQLKIIKPVKSNKTYIYKDRENVIFKCKIKKDPEKRVKYLHWYIQEQNPSKKERYSPFDFTKPFRFSVSVIQDENVAITSFKTTEWYMKKIPLRAYQPYSIFAVATDTKQKPLLRPNNEVIQDAIIIEYQPDISPELEINTLNLSKEDTNEITKELPLTVETQINNDPKHKLDKITWYLLSKEDDEFKEPTAIMQVEMLSEFEGKPFDIQIPIAKLKQLKIGPKYILRGIGQYENSEFIKTPRDKLVTLDIPIRVVEKLENSFTFNSNGRTIKITTPEGSKLRLQKILNQLTPEEKTELDYIIKNDPELEEIELRYKI